MKFIDKILIANRGEIACRIIRTAKSMGKHTVAVYSEADAQALHVDMADEAVCIGPGPVGQSYLLGDVIIEAALGMGAQAIHPGYGFLSENADFAAAVEAAGLVFIGPSAKAIDVMGNKAEAKRRMIKAGVPCVPGYEGEDQSDVVLVAEGNKIGFPIMVKAASGGGGRGMRLVHKSKDLLNAITTARSEALNAFGSGELILEKAIIEPRHVEVQVFADSHGNVIHLGERDCSVQRRHQKVVEEAPCPVMTPELRDRMGASAVEAARSISYEGAGTVEFLLDAQGNFYFLEMNTRLQVEHPVTEEVTNLDLVELQIKVAEGEALGYEQDDVFLLGHAIEVRLYAEDPNNNFLPSTGRVAQWLPAEGEGLRFDSGIRSGQEISPFYDPMIAKVIAYGDTRDIARRRLVEGLKNTALFGMTTNRDFLIDCLSKQTFIEGGATTAFIADEFGDDKIPVEPVEDWELACLSLLHYLIGRDMARSQALGVGDSLLNFSTMKSAYSSFRLAIGDDGFEAKIRSLNAGQYQIEIANHSYSLRLVDYSDGKASLEVDGVRVTVLFYFEASEVHASLDGRIRRCLNILANASTSQEGVSTGKITAPMHGRIVELFVTVGDEVEAGTRLAIVEAMKMQHEITSGVDGVVAEVFVKLDQQVAANDMMIDITEVE
ncbi:acetyl-CoA carboxylase biotin carboxylase subunit [Alphaproteobacteria bacterium]|jgi:geranyl-CoA carboxylase alpha subunit|nr:acetyl-CoA carboxylase biotin carboxylase subunit [Alphaproteobacteria bacterium]